jgi:magnesium chelatase subunit H
MDAHLAGAARMAERSLRKSLPGLTISFHAASDWEHEGEKRERVLETIAHADIIIAGMLFLENHAQPIMQAVQDRAETCDAVVCCLAAPELVKLTRIGKLRMDKPQSGPMALLKKLKPKKTAKAGSGESEAKMLRRLPQILKFIPGPAQDLRAYFLTMQYWLGGSDDNVKGMVAALIDRYADGPRRSLRGTLTVDDPVVYPETGIYHPRMTPSIAEDAAALPKSRSAPKVGVLIMRSYVLSGETAHYDAVIAALEARGIDVIPAFASGLDARPAIERFFIRDGKPAIDALISLTGFSLIGGPAYHDGDAASEVLSGLDIPYLSAHALEFQSLPEWGAGTRGLSPIEATMMVAMPELDGAIAPSLFGGRTGGPGEECRGCSRSCRFEGSAAGTMAACLKGAETIAARTDRLIALRRTEKAKKKVAVVLFNFPPNAGGTGTAAGLSVYQSLFNLLREMKAEGYKLDLPSSADALRLMITEGNAAQYGADANVHHRVPTGEHIRGESRLADLEKQWGAAPGRIQSDGASIHILGREFGNVFVGVQPAFGFEGDPMRLLFDGDFAPTHAFAAFYRYLRDDYRADAVIHFGTHGALEFMPGKQVSLSGDCWPSHLIGDLPNIYFYAGNNPSEAAIAKRRSGAVTVSYLTASVTEAGLYRSLADLKGTIDRWRQAAPDDRDQRRTLALLAQAQAASLELTAAEPLWDSDTDEQMTALLARLAEFENALIPAGLHVAGEPLTPSQRQDLLSAMAGPESPAPLPEAILTRISAGETAEVILSERRMKADADQVRELVRVNACLGRDTEIAALLRALDGRFIAPTAGGDLVSNSGVVPTGRNIHGFDPFRMPSAYALQDGAQQAQRLLERWKADHGSLPETIAFVLWGTDNLKTEGAQLAQVLALIGAKPRFDSYGRLTGASLLPLDKMSHPRIDVMATLSGIFRDLLPLQTRLLAEAALLAAQADEPDDHNFIRKHALAYQKAHGCDLQTAALRVFSNGDGAYGSNVNQLIDAGCWSDEAELADTYANRKCFAYGVDGKPVKHSELLGSILGHVDLAYQNLDSIELGVTTIDHYFDSLGGIGKAVGRARGKEAPVYIGDQTQGKGTVRTLKEQVALESRTRTLNPKWYEAMLKHGYEGVRQIEAQVTNTLGWSATTGDVAPWVYQEIASTFVLDEKLRNRLTELNPKACSRVTERLLEASDRRFWSPDPETLSALQDIGDSLEDRIEGIIPAQGASA